LSARAASYCPAALSARGALSLRLHSTGRDSAGIARLPNQFETVLVVKEHCERGGLGAMGRQVACDERVDYTLHTFRLNDEFIHEFGLQKELLAQG
jgi:hypothetical protein